MRVDFERKVYCLLGLPFDAVDMASVVRQIWRAAREHQQLFLSTPNVNFLIGCQTDIGFRDSVIHSDLSIPDGMPLVWIARVLGIPMGERIAGSSVLEALRGSTIERISVFFFGGPDGVAEAACQQLNTKSSGLTCVGFVSPGFGSIEDMSSDATIARINATHPDFLVVSLGAKKGQEWIERNRSRLSAPVISHLGAAVNFIAGTVSRAPVWMQNCGLEWLWRIKEEPTLWRRYFGEGLALIKLLATRVLPYFWYLKRHKVDEALLATSSLNIKEEGQSYIIRLRGTWMQSNMAPLRHCFAEAARSGKDVTLDMGEVTYVDSAFVGLVMLLQGHQSQLGRRLWIAHPQDSVRRVITYCCAEYLCDM